MKILLFGKKNWKMIKRISVQLLWCWGWIIGMKIWMIAFRSLKNLMNLSKFVATILCCFKFYHQKRTFHTFLIARVKNIPHCYPIRKWSTLPNIWHVLVPLFFRVKEPYQKKRNFGVVEIFCFVSIHHMYDWLLETLSNQLSLWSSASTKNRKSPDKFTSLQLLRSLKRLSTHGSAQFPNNNS